MVIDNWNKHTLKNYLRTAFRNIVRQKLYAVINLAGLAITLTVCIFIFLFVRNELSYDTFFRDYQRTYRVLGDSRAEVWGRVNIPWQEAAREAAQINSFTRIWEENGIVKRNDLGFKETLSLVDSDFFNVFSFALTYGNPSTVLQDIHSVVLSREMAEKLFGSQNPVGKSISIQIGFSFKDFIVSGVAARIPANSSIRFSVLIPYSNVKYTLLGMLPPQMAASMWGVSNLAPSAFVKLKSSSDQNAVERLLQILMKDYLSPYSAKTHFILQPISNIHLSPDIAWNVQKASNPVYLFILLVLGVLILLTSSINYINLTIARSSHRFKEIGIRKVIGASRRRLTLQFMSEAMILSFSSLLIAVASTEFLLPAFNQLTGKDLTYSFYGDGFTIIGLIVMAILVGLVSGGYPALYLSRLNPAEILKGEQKLSGRKPMTRIMIVFQFVISAGLLISAAIMLEQFNYMQSKDLGLDKENVLVITNPLLNNNDVYSMLLANTSIQTFMNEISNYNGIIGVTCSSEMLGQNLQYMTGTTYGNDTCGANGFTVGQGYLNTLGIKLIAGRNFSEHIASDTTDNVIVNETLVRELHISQPLGELISCPYPTARWGQVRIIGVVKDFNFESLNRRISPAVLKFSLFSGRNYIIVRLRSGNTFSTMSFLRKKWNEILPGMPFEYNFLDDYLNSLYSNAERWHWVIDYSATLAVLIALMGLFGLASYSVEKRTKEIGIRRILGARSSDIVRLIYREFFLLVLVASVLACPMAWYLMHKWLQDFAYRIDITVWPFLVTSLAVLLATLLVTLVHVVSAATANPVEALSYE